MRAERGRRGDLVAAAVLVLALAAGVATLWWYSPAAGTSSHTAAEPLVAPLAATVVPTGFAFAWQAPSAATPGPVVAGPAVVTADGSTVVGWDARIGAQTWSYTRDLPLCTAAAGFPAADGGVGRVFALYRNVAGDRPYCSELTSLRPDTGARAAQRNPDARPGTRVLADAGLIALTGTDHAEILRSPDLVRTLEFGDVPAPVQPNQQPRSGCTFGSFAFDAARLGVVERCPGEPTDRLTVLAAEGPDGPGKPTEQFSVPLPGPGARIVALSSRRTAVALSGPPRLLIVDEAGAQTALVPLDLPDSDLAADPPGGAVPTAADVQRRYWWTGSRTIALDAADLTPIWTLRGTLGAGTRYAEALLVPVPDGLAEVDITSGAVRRTIAVTREDRSAPVVVAAHGELLLEQRGPTLVALRPWG